MTVLKHKLIWKNISVGKTTISTYENSHSTPTDEITIALHSDADCKYLPQEAKDEIYNFIDFVKRKYKYNLVANKLN